MPTQANTMTPRSARYTAAPRSSQHVAAQQQAASAQPPRRHMELEELPDGAARSLYYDQSLTDGQRADLYDLFHASKSTTELAEHLSMLPLSPRTKENLLHSKNRMIAPAEPAAPVSHLDKIVAVLHRMAAMDPATLDLVEKHSNVFKALLSGNEE